jgi:hypothetical protein
MTTKEHLTRHDCEIAEVRGLHRESSRLPAESRRAQTRIEHDPDRLERKQLLEKGDRR